MNTADDVLSRDFLHKHAETPLCEQYIAAGALCDLSTNSERVLEAARQSFLPIRDRRWERQPSFSLRLWVDERDTSQPPWPKPYLRGLDHLVYIGLDSKSSLLADLETRRVIGRIAPGLAADTGHWRNIIFPMMMSVVAGSVGLVELHASCVAKGPVGMILLGPGRSGKSTLAKAMSNAGFRVLSDDRVFCSVQQEGIRAYGLARPLKLREDAGIWFEEFSDRTPTDVQNGERVFYCDRSFPSLQPCEPTVIVSLERAGDGCSISHASRSEIRRQIESDLLAETEEIVNTQATVIDSLLNLPLWHVECGARPEVIAGHLVKLLPEQAA